MIQIFFFVTLISIAAFALNIIWYISDSHEEEYLLVSEIRNRKSYRKCNQTNTQRYSRVGNTGNIAKKGNKADIINNNESINGNFQFFDFGLESASSRDRETELQSEKVKYRDNEISYHDNCA